MDFRFILAAFAFIYIGQFNVLLGESKTWIWQGALMSTSIRFSVKTDEQEEFKIVSVRKESKDISFARRLDLSAGLKSLEADIAIDESVKFNNSAVKAFHMILEGLEPDAEYTWSATGDIHGKFQTPPRTGTRYNFTFAFGSCADNDSDHVLFSLIPHNQNPLFMIHTGDLHYGNLNRNDVRAYASMYDRTLLRPNQAYMFQHLPVVYMWDDHDYGPNNADKFSPGRPAAMEAYRSFIPSYALGSSRPDGAVYFSFTIGRVFFIVTDTSSERDPTKRTTLGGEQLEWLKGKLAFAAKRTNNLAAIVWVSTLPWIDDYYKWGEFPEERALIGTWIESLNLKDRMIIVSGDAHMLAADDGSHAVGGVKVFHAAALDAKPTTKGGPYSHGVWPGRNQYGTITVRDEDHRICFVFQGWRWKREKVLSRMVMFDTCDTEGVINRELLFKPSPLFVQRIWKRIKKIVEEYNLGVIYPFIFWIDSSRLTFHSLAEPRYALLALSIILSTIIFPLRRLFRR